MAVAVNLNAGRMNMEGGSVRIQSYFAGAWKLQQL